MEDSKSGEDDSEDWDSPLVFYTTSGQRIIIFDCCKLCKTEDP